MEQDIPSALSFEDFLSEVVGPEIAAANPITDTAALFKLRENAVKKIAFNLKLKKNPELNTAELWADCNKFLWGIGHVETATIEL
jgi:hypothetical protein